MSTDGIQNFSGDAELIDGVLRDNDSEEDTYQIDQDNDEIASSDEEDEDLQEETVEPTEEEQAEHDASFEDSIEVQDEEIVLSY